MMISVNTSPFHLSMLRRLNVWYSIGDGNWTDPAIWISNGRKRYLTPQSGDHVYINHNVTCDSTLTVGNIYIAGNLKFSTSANPVLTIAGDLQATGTVDQSGGASMMSIGGYNNYIANYIGGNNGTIEYNGLYDQYIMPLLYQNLIVSGTNQKYLSANTVINGNLNVFANMECGNFDLVVNGTTDIDNYTTGTFRKSGLGNMLFIGPFGVGSNSNVNLSGNPDVVCRGGLNLNGYQNSGTGTFTFTNSNQDFRIIWSGTPINPTPVTWNAPIFINGAITVTIKGNVYLSSAITGDNPLSTVNNNGNITHQTLLSLNIMESMGIFNWMNLPSSYMIYSIPDTYSLPFGTYANLTTNPGTVSLNQNTVVYGNFINTGTGTFDCAGYDLTVNGTSEVSYSNFNCSGPSNLLFIGSFQHNGGQPATINFSGNPNIEFRDGFVLNVDVINSGTGTWKFTANSQTLNIINIGTSTITAPILISGAIQLTLKVANGTYNASFSGQINGDVADSILILFTNGLTLINYFNANAPMITGQLWANQSVNTFVYGLAGNQDIQSPFDPINPGYYNLLLNGSGSKRLLGNVSVKEIYTLTSPATLDSNGFHLSNP